MTTAIREPLHSAATSGAPDHWIGRPLKYWVRINGRTLPESTDADYRFEYLDIGAVGTGRLTRRPTTLTFSSAPSRARRVLTTGDTIVSTVRTYLKAIYTLRGDHRDWIASTGFAVLTPPPTIDADYLGYVIESPHFIDQITSHSVGTAYPAINESVLGRFHLALPPALEEQRTMSLFLRHADRRINRLIRTKRRLIELLNEQKQVIINRAVTRGLDPNVRLKPSGIDWLGEVPEHWEVLPLRRLALKRCDGPFGSGLKSSHYVDSGVRVVRLQNIGFAEFRAEDKAYISSEHYASLGDHDVIPGDVLVAGLGDSRIPPGRACVAPTGIEPAMVKADCFRFRLRSDKLAPSFAALQLTATASAAGSLSRGATRQRINLTSAANRLIAVPPYDEQERLVEHVANVIAPILAASSRAEREIDLVREYRTRLIADVVTGKLDVRGVELPPLDEDDSLEEIDAGYDETDELIEDSVNADD